jgi:hypothetical protein
MESVFDRVKGSQELVAGYNCTFLLSHRLLVINLKGVPRLFLVKICREEDPDPPFLCLATWRLGFWI